MPVDFKQLFLLVAAAVMVGGLISAAVTMVSIAFTFDEAVNSLIYRFNHTSINCTDQYNTRGLIVNLNGDVLYCSIEEYAKLDLKDGNVSLDKGVAKK